jgi:CubicO group peptidase (beta-lactamase class C family)
MTVSACIAPVPAAIQDREMISPLSRLTSQRRVRPERIELPLTTMRTLRRVFLALALAAIVCAAQPLPRSSAEAQGVSSAALDDFVKALDAIEGMHGVVVLRHGQVIAEGWWKPYNAAQPHVLYSLSKSFTSTAVGMAIAEGKLSLDDQVLKFFPGDAPANPSDNLKAMRVRDLLMMSTGHQDEPPVTPDEISAKTFLAQPVPHLPGTHFKYNTAATFTLSAIVQKVTGQTVLDYLGPRLFSPLGIESPVWDANFQGISLGGYGLRVRTEDIAKFGQLYLQRGNWKGQQLLPAPWVALATSRQTSNGSNPDSDWNQGYGFQFWRCRHNAYRGDGAFGQYCLVLPDQDAVVAINSGVKDMQAVLNVIWDKLLPAFQPHPLEANPDASQHLKTRLEQLGVSPARGAAASAQGKRWLNRKYAFAANERQLQSVTLVPGDAGKTLTLVLQQAGKQVKLASGYQRWEASRGPLSIDKMAQFADEPYGGTFAWVDDNTCTIKLCATGTPYQLMLTLKFSGDQVTLDSEANVAFASARQEQLTGRAE